MTEKQLQIRYEEYSSIEELGCEDQALARAAIEAMSGSYSPYSRFRVGAAVRLEDGLVLKGANQENAAYPSGLCAERTVLFSTGALYPDKAVVSIAIAGGPDGVVCDSPATPCGACRQVMAETQKRGGVPMSVILVGAKLIWKFNRVDDVLPFIFTSLD